MHNFAALLQTCNLVCKQADIIFWIMETIKHDEAWLGALSHLDQVERYCKKKCSRTLPGSESPKFMGGRKNGGFIGE